MVKTRHQRLLSTTPSPGPLPERRKKKKLTVSDVTSQDDIFCDQTPLSELTEISTGEKSKIKESEDEIKESEVTKSNETAISSVVEEISNVVSMETNSDEAPENVSFNESRHCALETMHHALQGVKRSHIKMKEQRRARDDLFKRQKKQKLKSVRLSEDLLKEVTEEEKIAKLPYSTESYDSDDSSISSNTSSQNVGIHAVTLPKIIEKSKTRSEVAMDFLQRQLYGGRVKRQSVNDLYAQKRKLQGRAAFKFTTGKVSHKKKQRK